MDSREEKINILIVGATGNLGTLVTKYCLTKPNLIVSVLVRDPQKNKELITEVEKTGGKVIKGNIAQPETLKGVTKGIHTIIFTLPTFVENAVVDGEMALIKDGVENGVERVVPSEFVENWTTLTPEELPDYPPFAQKKKVRDYLVTLPIKALYINTGLFLDTYFQFLQAKEYGYWGSSDQKFDLTSYEDTARFIAAAVARKDRVGDLVFVSNKVTIPEVTEIYNKVRGTNIIAKHFGSLEDLIKEAEELEKKGDPTATIKKMYPFLFDEKSKFEKTNNSEFPEVKKTSIEEFLKERPDIVII